MALQLKRTLDNGIIVNYHRVSFLSTDFSALMHQIRVTSYTSAEVRSIEVAQQTRIEQFRDLKAELDLIVDQPTIQNEQRRIVLSEQINELSLELSQTEHLELSVLTTEYQLRLNNDITTCSQLYDHLKTLHEFSEAEDV